MHKGTKHWVLFHCLLLIGIRNKSEEVGAGAGMTCTTSDHKSYCQALKSRLGPTDFFKRGNWPNVVLSKKPPNVSADIYDNLDCNR